MKLFNNPEIFQSASDYEVGGFKTRSPHVEFEDIKAAAEDRIYKAVDSYLMDEENSPIEGNPTQEGKMINAQDKLAETIFDSLGIEVNETTAEGIADQILAGEHFLCWLNKVKIRCVNYKTNKKAIIGIPVNTGESSEEETEAYEDINLEKILDILSGIFDV
jgi:hypothetical protein